MLRLAPVVIDRLVCTGCTGTSEFLHTGHVSLVLARLRRLCTSVLVLAHDDSLPYVPVIVNSHFNVFLALEGRDHMNLKVGGEEDSLDSHVVGHRLSADQDTHCL